MTFSNEYQIWLDFKFRYRKAQLHEFGTTWNAHYAFLQNIRDFFYQYSMRIFRIIRNSKVYIAIGNLCFQIVVSNKRKRQTDKRSHLREITHDWQYPSQETGNVEDISTSEGRHVK